MIAATVPSQRPANARLLALDVRGELHHLPRARFVDLLRPNDIVIANDAATLPASLAGRHLPTSRPIEVRLAGARSLGVQDGARFVAIVFGAGDFHTRTEDRPAPPALAPGDRLEIGPIIATIERLLDHPRLVELRFEGTAQSIWQAIAHHGRPIQYAHVHTPLAMWDVWTPIAGAPLAFEPPSAGFALDWQSLTAMRERGVGFATITLAAGISSTGDAALDKRLPFDEPYRIPEATAAAIRKARSKGGRVIAVGTTVVRALESSAGFGGKLRAGDGVARLRIGPSHGMRIVDVILSGTHELGTSHHEMLRAFADDATLARMHLDLEAHGYRTHEFGDSVWIERSLFVGEAWMPSRGERMLRTL